MATKSKHRSKDTAATLLQQAQRWLAKGDFKQALKDAKVAYRQQTSPEARQVLERAYLGRGRQLHRAGLQVESRDVVESLLELKPTDASVQQELPELLIALGLFHRIDVVRQPDAEAQSSPLHSAVADHAVLRPETAPASLPAIGREAAAVRRALAALEADHDADALAALKDISRASPLADWKYFVRGLAAYYRQDVAEMQANWDRLDTGRMAVRIAASLKVLADPEVATVDDPHTTDTLARLGGAVLGGPILSHLQALQNHVAAGRWREAVKLMRAANSLLGRMDAALPQRLTNAIYAAIVRSSDPATIGKLAAVVEPLPIDPHWNRGLAMAWEHADSAGDENDADVTSAERYWRKYLDDLHRLECLLPTERTLAQALVWLRLGKMLEVQSCPMCPTCGVRHEPDEDAQARAIDCFESALKLSPELLRAYRALAEAYRGWDDPRQAAAVWRRLVERFPEDVDTLLLLADHHIRRDEPFEAGEFVSRARRLKPLDADIKQMAAAIHLAAARHHALAGRFDEGRAEFAAAEQLGSPHVKHHHLLVRRAALELRAGDPDRARQLLDQAGRASDEAGPVWLMMAIESRRYALSQAVAEEFEHRWVTGLKKSRRTVAVGEMCQILTAHLKMNTEYAGIDAHLKILVDFLGTCKRIRWQAADLRDALSYLLTCEHREEHRAESFLDRRETGKIAQLLEDLSARARRKFPDEALFQFLVGEMEMRKGPRQCNRSLARNCFGRVLELTVGANDPDSLESARRARDYLDLLDAAEGRRLGRMPILPTFMEDGDDDPYEASLPPFYIDDDEEGAGLPPLFPPDFATGSPKKLFSMFTRMCEALGLDLEDILDDASAGKPFRFATKSGPPQPRKKKK